MEFTSPKNLGDLGQSHGRIRNSKAIPYLELKELTPVEVNNDLNLLHFSENWARLNSYLEPKYMAAAG